MTCKNVNQNDKTIHDILQKYHISATTLQIDELSAIIQKTLYFNRCLFWDSNVKNIALVKTEEELLEIYVLRSKIYAQLHYDKEFPDKIKGLNYDTYDTRSAILYTQSNAEITGTCRIIIDVDKKLPLDKNFSLDYLRQKDKKLAELSRLIIDKKIDGLGQEPRLLTKGAYLVMKYNALTTLVSVMIAEHFKFYDKFGGFKIEDKIEAYGNIGTSFIITSWDIAKISKFFKKVFLMH